MMKVADFKAVIDLLPPDAILMAWDRTNEQFQPVTNITGPMAQGSHLTALLTLPWRQRTPAGKAVYQIRTTS